MNCAIMTVVLLAGLVSGCMQTAEEKERSKALNLPCSENDKVNLSFQMWRNRHMACGG